MYSKSSLLHEKHHQSTLYSKCSWSHDKHHRLTVYNKWSCQKTRTIICQCTVRTNNRQCTVSAVCHMISTINRHCTVSAFCYMASTIRWQWAVCHRTSTFFRQCPLSAVCITWRTIGRKDQHHQSTIYRKRSLLDETFYLSTVHSKYSLSQKPSTIAPQWTVKCSLLNDKHHLSTMYRSAVGQMKSTINRQYTWSALCYMIE